MADYRIKFKASAAKEFRKLPAELKQRLRKAINKLSQEPRPAGVTKLKGDDRLYRIRIGNYRVVYKIDDEIKVVLITRIRHRRDVYRGN